MTLNISAEISAIKKRYDERKDSQGFNLLLLGESGSGKSFLLRTARFPVFIDSFDQGGSKGLRKWIDSGDIVVDSRWEEEDPFKPKAYKDWKREFESRLASGFFNHFGTYCIDSATTFSTAIMNFVLAKAGIAGQAPRFTHDYTPQKIEIVNSLTKALQVPCDFILTGHLKLIEEVDATGKPSVKFRFMTTGQAMVTIPLMFDEIYIMLTKETSQGVKRQLLTDSTSVHMARSRLKADGLLQTYEEPDLKALLKKAGVSHQDKPKLKFE